MAQIQSTLKRRKRSKSCSPEESAAIKAAYGVFSGACREADRKAKLLDAQTRRGMHKLIN